MNNRWKWSLLGLAGAALATAFFMAIRKPPLPPALPVSNGYDDLVKATGQVVSEGRAYRDVSDAELRDLVRQNREVLESVRAACQRECRAPIVYDRGSWNNQSHILAGFKWLARAFWAEAVLAEREGRTNDAARIYVDGIRFGQEIGHGGRLIDRLVGMSCQSLLLPSLTNLVQNLDAQTCRELAGLLESMDLRSEPWEATVRRERI